MNSKYAFLIVAVIVVIAASGFVLTRHKPATTAVEGAKTTAKLPTANPVKSQPTAIAPSTVISKTTTEISPSSANSSLTYKDGNYDVVGTYQSPAGDDQIEVKITLNKDIISDVDVISKAPDAHHMSQHFQGIFIANYKPMVLGKNIDDVQLDKVSGSSLTPKGFNDALQQIKQQAKA